MRNRATHCLRASLPGIVALFLMGPLVGCLNFYEEKLSKDLPPLEPKFSSLRRRIFERRCTGCHSSGGTAEKVPLINLKELLASPRELVIPGNVEESGLLIALQRNDDKRMPPPERGSPLNADEIQTIRDWIAQGAKDN